MADIKANDRRFFFLWGNDDYLLRRTARNILDAYAGAGITAGDETVLSGPVPDMEALVTACITLSFYPGLRPVVVAGLDLSAMGEEDMALLCTMAGEAESALLVIWSLSGGDDKRKKETENKAQADENEGESPPAEKKEKAKAKPNTQANIKRLRETAMAAGGYYEVTRPTGRELTAFVEGEIQAAGAKAGPGAAGELIELCGADSMWLLHNEAEKLAAGAGYKVVTKATVAALATRNLEANIFDLGDAIVAKNGARAFSVLETVLAGGASEYMVVGVLAGFFTDACRARAADASGRSGRFATDFKYGKEGDYRVQKIRTRGKKLSDGALFQAIDILARLDGDLRSSPVDGRILLENAVTRLLGI